MINSIYNHKDMKKTIKILNKVSKKIQSEEICNDIYNLIDKLNISIISKNALTIEVNHKNKNEAINSIIHILNNKNYITTHNSNHIKIFDLNMYIFIKIVNELDYILNFNNCKITFLIEADENELALRNKMKIEENKKEID